jgi:hypothetical protein
MPEPFRKVVAVDFDGTLAVTKYPTIIKPINLVFNYVKEQQKNGAIIILWTCRHGKELEEAVEFCRENGLEFDYINENVPERIEAFGECRKISADEYIDDRAVNPMVLIMEQISNGIRGND